MYNDSRKDTNFVVKPFFFTCIFNTNFNIGFGSSVTDACSLYLSLKGKLKRCQGRKKINEARIFNNELEQTNAFFLFIMQIIEKSRIYIFSEHFTKNEPRPFMSTYVKIQLMSARYHLTVRKTSLFREFLIRLHTTHVSCTCITVLSSQGTLNVNLRHKRSSRFVDSKTSLRKILT